MTSKRSPAASYGAVAVAMLPVVRRVVADKQLRDDFRRVIKSGRRLSGHTQVEGAGKKAQSRLTDPGVSAQRDSFMDALEDVARSVHHAIVRESEPRHRGRWLLLGGAVVAGTAYLWVGRSDVRDWVISMVRPGDRDTEMIAT